MGRGWIPASLLALVLGINFSCGCSPTRPSPMNMTGIWSGTLGPATSGTSVRLVWNATQSFSDVSGPVTISKPVDNLNFAGTLSGTLNAQNLSLTFTVPAGSVPGFADCRITGTGAGAASNSVITGTITVTATSCEGFTGHPTGTQSLSLTKQ